MPARTVRTTAVVTPAWARLGSLVLSVAGLGVAAYLTIDHYTTSTILACPANSTINCAKVTTSDAAYVAGIPVALLGLLYFGAMVALTVPAAWRSTRREFRLARLGAAVVGVLMVMYLVYAELFDIGYICLWCTAVHVITVALFAILVLGTAREQAG
jgi:uncharacterized membrane protein